MLPLLSKSYKMTEIKVSVMKFVKKHHKNMLYRFINTT